MVSGRWTALLLALICLTGVAKAQPTEPERPGQADFLKRALFAEGRLWVLSDDGVLSSIGPAADERERESTPGKVLDICALAGRIALVAADEKGGSSWSMYIHRIEGAWAQFAAVRQEGDGLVGLTCGANDGELITNKRLILLRQDEVGLASMIPLPLMGHLRGGLITSLHSEPNAVWTGIDAGEWGGGLMRIDMGSGKVTTVEENTSGALCGGPLNSACDPVNGIEDEPWKPGCLVVSVGLEHLLASGRLVEVCPTGIRTLFELPLGAEVGRDGRPLNTVPFFGLVRAGNTIWAGGADGLYQVTESGAVRVGAFPAFKNVGGVYVNFNNPHFVLVLTQINRRAAVSGRTPMLVAR
jgi:hypothetical protein